MSIKDMAKETQNRRRTAFDAVKGQRDEQTPEEATNTFVEPPTKLKTKVSDYAGKQFKKTSVEIPEEVLYAWSVYCSTHRVKKRDHFLEILTKDLNKKNK